MASPPMFGDHDKTCCWMNGLYSDEPMTLSGADTVNPEKDEGDVFEGGWLRTAAIAAGAGVAVFIIAKTIEKSRK